MSNENTHGQGLQPSPWEPSSHTYMKSTNPPQPAYLCMTQGENVQIPVVARDFLDNSCAICSKLKPGDYLPDLRSPSDCYHSETYLIGWLVKLYCWRVLEPGTLRRGWNGPEVTAGLEVAA